MLNMVAATVMLLVVLTLALRSAQSSPPAIAEFAPQAQQIRQAPSEQTSAVGSGENGSGAAVAPSPSPAAPGRPASAVFLHCVGDPPRQIEDPQSPPCVPFWQGNNGGATSKGVGDSVVKIFVPDPTASVSGHSGDDGTQQPYVEALSRFFNARFEFYGRQIELDKESAAGQDCSATAQQSWAVYADEQAHAFASTFYNACGDIYGRALAQRHLIASVGEESQYDQPTLRRYAPYLWQYVMAADDQFRNDADWICSRLAGRDAVHAQDVTMRAQVRRFGVVYDPQSSADKPSLAPLLSGLQACGASPAYVYQGQRVSDYGGTGIESDETIVTAMEQDGVTSVLCLCEWSADGDLQRHAQEQGYFPEWLQTSFGQVDQEAALKAADLLGGPPTYPGNFGITFRPRQISLDKEPYIWAIREAGLNDAANEDIVHMYERREFYRSLLLLMAGIQMAGPNLTPYTFESGLQHALFPNPDYPFTMPGKVGFLGQSHSMTVDAAEWWWSDTTHGPYPGDSSGTVCTVASGARHMLGDWPRTGDPFFAGPCDAG